MEGGKQAYKINITHTHINDTHFIRRGVPW